ncbi:hypothetical protein Patl1_08384 [Pistacia atlantica]|uniref:Uncharacterized protein n=1 Tax=Pistacia atlantica TaxID=434234 RepID=A0ACC1AGW7_9ROSI|nr:hypothetical protein Patl1_08384 [Pistacia atlantica]
MASAPSKLYTDDVSLVVVLLDTNPFFWNSSYFSFSQFLSHVLAFLNAILTLNQLNQVVVIATGYNTCDYIYDSSLTSNQSFGNSRMRALCGILLQNLEEFLIKDENLGKQETDGRISYSLLSGSLSMALCCILLTYRGFSARDHCIHNLEFYACRDLRMVLNSMLFMTICTIFICFVSTCALKGFLLFRYVAIMNAIFSAQRSMVLNVAFRFNVFVILILVSSFLFHFALVVPIDSCYIGAQNSAFLQQASYITGGVHHKPQQLDGLFQYLMTIFGTDLHSRNSLQLPKPVGVDFRASCFCHKNTIDMGYICSVCLSIFCKHHKKCSTCGSVFGQAQLDDASAENRKRKAPDS